MTTEPERPPVSPAAGDSGPDRNIIVAGWLFVGIQGLLLIALILWPRADHWPVPGWLNLFGAVLVASGLVLVAVAVIGLGSSATPTPVPTERGKLVTTGLYRFSRHPIYSGVLLAVIGIVIRSGNLVTLLIGASTGLFFTIKARWEEDRLEERYPDYHDYAAQTGRFLPRFRRRGS